MRVMRVVHVYDAYARQFYARRPELAAQPFAEQLAAHNHQGYSNAGAWVHALRPLGYEVLEVTANLLPMQRAWARENGLSDPENASAAEIVFAQARQFQPEVIWYDYNDAVLLKRLRTELKSVRLAIGWTGSALPTRNPWQFVDVVLSCAPESVELLRRMGKRAEHVHHGFDPTVNQRLIAREPTIPVSFVGQLVRHTRYHLNREEILLALADRIELSLFSPARAPSARDYLRAGVCGGLYGVVRCLSKVGLMEAATRRSALARRVALAASPPRLPVNPRLARLIRPAVYGLEMYQTLRDSWVTLNIHAASSPTYASNMRLFEGTGVGTCLLTDWKENLPTLFEPDREVVAYRSAEECAEKARWLLDHPRERNEIALRGQQRVLREHTVAHRAGRIHEIIQSLLCAGSRSLP
ncbi:MAG: glycosyltransferase [Armatimonadota bacterium]|nr:glycosyltransferase [Armatimonadota bacterium]